MVVSSLTCMVSWPVSSLLISTWQVLLKLKLFIEVIYNTAQRPFKSITRTKCRKCMVTDSCQIIELKLNPGKLPRKMMTLLSLPSYLTFAAVSFCFSLDQRRLRSFLAELFGRPVDSQQPCLLSSSSSSSRPPSAASTTASRPPSASPESEPSGGKQAVYLAVFKQCCHRASM